MKKNENIINNTYLFFNVGRETKVNMKWRRKNEINKKLYNKVYEIEKETEYFSYLIY